MDTDKDVESACWEKSEIMLRIKGEVTGLPSASLHTDVQPLQSAIREPVGVSTAN